MKKKEPRSQQPEVRKKRRQEGRKKLGESFLFLIILLASVFCLLSSSHAQPPSPGDGGMAEKQERLQTLITMRLANELGLTQEQALKVSGIMKKYQQKRRELHQKMQGLNQQLRTVVSTDDSTKSSQIVSDIQKTKEEIDAIDGAMFKEIRPLLNPQQQAKFLLVMEDIRKEIRQFRRGGPGMGGPPSIGNPPPSK